jgi:hypothetical protein
MNDTTIAMQNTIPISHVRGTLFNPFAGSVDIFKNPPHIGVIYRFDIHIFKEYHFPVLYKSREIWLF